MKNIRILRIAILVIIATSALIGCAISFSLSPTASIARVIIDVGAMIALLWITYSLPRPEAIHIDDIVDGIRDLARNRFDRRLSLKEQDELFPVRQAFNELAGTLSDSRDSSLTHIRYNPMNRVESRGITLSNLHHSIHPELGQVKTAAEPENESQTAPSDFNIDTQEQKTETHEASQHEDWALEAKAVEPFAPLETVSHLENEPEEVPSRPESYPSDIGTADFFFLFEKFKAAHDETESDNIEFDDFLMTVQKTREDLIREHRCQDVKFEVVNTHGAVALRPRLIR